MKDLFAPAREIQEGFLENPFSLAGLMMGRGHGNLSFSDALTQSASVIREREQGKINAMEQERRQQQLMNDMQEDERKRRAMGELSQIVKNNPQMTDQQVLQLAWEKGLPLKGEELKAFRPQYHPVYGTQTNSPAGTGQIQPTNIPGNMQNPNATPFSIPGAEPNKPTPSNDGFGNTPAGQKDIFHVETGEAADIRKENRKILQESATEAKGDARKLHSVRSVKKLIPKFYQGAGSNFRYGVERLFNTKSAAAYEDFLAKASELVLDISKEQKGAQSDPDMIRMEATKPNVNNTLAGNLAIADGLESIYERNIQYNKAKQKFVREGLGTPEEFDTRWTQYVDGFPLTEDDDSEGGTIKVNKNNIKNWDIIFRPDFDQIIGAMQPIEGSNNVPKNNMIQTPWGLMTREELDRIADGKE